MAFSGRDGRTRMFGYFESEQSAWEMVLMFWDMLSTAGDYFTINVKRTIQL